MNAASPGQPRNEPGLADEPQSPAVGGGLMGLAQRVSTWTTRLILSGIVIVIGLAFGRQVLHWWAADTGVPDRLADNMPLDRGLGDGSQPHMLTFGSSPWNVQRREVAGTQQAATTALTQQCRDNTQGRHGLPGEPDAAEKALLRRLAGAEPVERSPSGWEIHVTEQGPPMAVGVWRPSATAEAAKSNLAERGARVVTWGVAVPAGENAWTLYTFQPEPRNESRPGGLPEVPLPPGARGTLSLRAAGGGAVAGFEGDTDPNVCQQFYRRWFADRGWTIVADWRPADGGWFARYRSSGQPRATADVRVGFDRNNRLSGLLIVSE